MLPRHDDDLIGYWTGLIVHSKGAVEVRVDIKGIQEDGSLYGSYSFPGSKPPEPGGDFAGERFGPLLFIKLKDKGKLRFHLHITGETGPEMMYGAIPRANGKSPHSTITVFPSKEAVDDWQIFGLWQDFFLKDL